MEKADVAVVGLGAMGSAALWRLAARGADVVGFEQFGIAHPFGSSHGRSRLFREACLEHQGLAPLAASSRALFRELEAATGTDLLHISGGLLFGAPDSDVVAGTLRAARANGLEHGELDAAEISRRYPQHAGIGPDTVGVWDPGAGLARPEATIAAAVAAARRMGAVVHANTTVEGIDPAADGVVISAAGRKWRADRVIIAAGAWLPRFEPAIGLHPIRTPLNWFQARGAAGPRNDVAHIEDAGGRGDAGPLEDAGEPDDAGAEAEGPFDLGRFPVFVRQLDPETVLWGHGSFEGPFLKLGLGDIWGHLPPRVDPSTLDRGVNSADWSRLSGLVRRVLPGLDPVPARVEPCMITISPDEQFTIGPTRSSGRVIIAGGDSGHAFKHAPAIGEILARDAVGQAQELDIGFIRPTRFGA